MLLREQLIFMPLSQQRGDVSIKTTFSALISAGKPASVLNECLLSQNRVKPAMTRILPAVPHAPTILLRVA